MSEGATLNPQNPTRREMGDQERFLHNIHRYGGLIAVQMMHIFGPLSPDLVRQALDRLQRNHPILQAHLQVTGIGVTREFPWTYLRRFLNMAGTHPIPLQVIECASLDDWQSHMQHELKTPIRGKRLPLLRATLLISKNAPDEVRLLVASDHAIADAQGAQMITCQLMEFFGDSKNPRILNEGCGLPPTLESLTPPKTRKKHNSYVPAIRLDTPYFNIKRRQTKVIKSTISSAQTTKIKQILAQKSTSMHGLICACALSTLGKEHGLDELTCLSNVELRHMCSPQLADDIFGCYIDIVRTRHKLNVPLWDLAQNVKFQLITTLARNQAGASILKIPEPDFYKKEGMANFKTGMRLDAIAVTTASEANILSQYGEVTLKDMIVCVSLGTLGANYFLLAIERDGALDLNLCYVHPSVQNEEAQILLNSILTQLKNLPND